MSHFHSDPDRPCRHRTRKLCDEEYAAWQANSQVALARKVVAEGRVGAYAKDKTQFAQLVRIVAGEQSDFLTEDGVASEAAWIKRLRAALDQPALRSRVEPASS